MSPTEICNMSLGRIGAVRINSYDSDGSPNAIHCRLHFWQSMFFVMKSFDWPFARARAELSAHTSTPAFEWDYQYLLPSDFLSMRKNYTESPSEWPDLRCEIEGDYLMTNDSEVDLKYTKKVTDTAKFDPMFIEVAYLHLTTKLVPPIAGVEATGLMDRLEKELDKKINKTRTKILQENNKGGRSDWNYAHYGSRSFPR